VHHIWEREYNLLLALYFMNVIYIGLFIMFCLTRSDKGSELIAGILIYMAMFYFIGDIFLQMIPNLTGIKRFLIMYDAISSIVLINYCLCTYNCQKNYAVSMNLAIIGIAFKCLELLQFYSGTRI